MNSVFALLALFILGLQDFDGNNGITSVEGVSADIVACINWLFNACDHVVGHNKTYLQGEMTMDDLKEKLREKFPSGNIPTANKQVVQRQLSQISDPDAQTVSSYLDRMIYGE